MHKRLIEEGFNRRYVLLPMLLAITLVLLGYWITDTRRDQALQLSRTLREREDVIRLLAEASYKAMEAESGQRGFLLTGEEQYLPQLEAGLAATGALLGELREHYRALEPAELPVMDGLAEDLRIRAGEMRQSVALQKQGKRPEALALVKTDLGLYQTFAIIQALEALRTRERDRISEGLSEWERTVQINARVNTGAVVFTVLLLLLMGLLVTRDIRRRNFFATQLATQIDARTAELRDLSLHMSRVAEAEKHALARELHDELGGLLVAMRMDISQIRKRLGPTTDEDMLTRWTRVEQALSQGLELKRRVIENLRPTLLDNMGLFTALRWLATQGSEQAQLTLHMEGLDEDIDIPPETAIAVFRTVQEAVANVIRHSGAKKLEVKAWVGERLSLEITDDGCGVPPDADRHVGSHGLKQMRFRMEAVGGTLAIVPRMPRGTSILLSVPLEEPAAQRA